VANDLERDKDIRLLEELFREAIAKCGTDWGTFDELIRVRIQAIAEEDRKRLLGKLEHICAFDSFVKAYKHYH
jgi:hypothetical protein